MTAKESELMRQLETRVRQLLLQDKDLKERCRSLEAELADRDVEIRNLESRNKASEERYANLKVARMLELSDSDKRNARQRLNHLVRDVDKCIALLKG